MILFIDINTYNLCSGKSSTYKLFHLSLSMELKDDNIVRISPLDKNHKKLLLYSRFLILHTLFYFSDDGVAYSDLKDTKKNGIPEGSLSPNLLWLKKHGYIREEPRDGNENVYFIKSEGKTALRALMDWLDNMIKIFNEVDKDGREK